MLASKTWTQIFIAASSAALLTLASCTEVNEPAQHSTSYKTRSIEEDVIYFVLPDRFANANKSNDTGGIEGGPLDHGFDPTHKGFYHGGDFEGLKNKLDYLKDLGVTALWIAPIYKNKPVQHYPGGTSAGYHGYWITDFLDTDPHFGTKEEFKQLVDAAHSRDMKVILDIVTNHTADVIKYEECDDKDNPNGPIPKDAPFCSYRPFGEAQYTPFVAPEEVDVKNPHWLNDVALYNNRGGTHWEGESAVYGDFAGLDDLDTRNPQVVEGMIDIFKYWISTFKVDGFRIDTVKHVDDSFWHAFVPAIEDHAKAEGIEEFAIFGEVYNLEPSALARFTHEAAMPAVLDFAFQDAARSFISKGEGAQALHKLFAQDQLYHDNTKAARRLPTFLGNHDMGRIGHFLALDKPEDSDDIRLRKHILSHALLLFSRGVPVIYYGDEQGFTGDGHDQDARDDMFATRVASYLDNDLIGSQNSTAQDNYNQDGAIYQMLQRLIQVRRQEAALQFGQLDILEIKGNPQVFAFTRTYQGQRILVALNAGEKEAEISLSNGAYWSKVISSDDNQSGNITENGLIVPTHGFVVLKATPKQAK